MLVLLHGTDWKLNTDTVMRMLAQDVAAQRGGRVLLVPESISHASERSLSETAGDTASRFAEVLSFPRLVSRVQETDGNGAYGCMDNGGRVVTMASAAVQLHNKLKAYAAVETKPEFLTALLDVVDEFKRCCITAEDLRTAAQLTQGSLAQKLEELSLLLETYDSLCARGKRDPRDQMTWLLEQLEDDDYAQTHVFYIDGFPDFTRQHMKILQHLILHSKLVVVSLNCDRPGSDAPAYVTAGDTAAQLLRFASENGVQTRIHHIEPEASALQSICSKLFQGSIPHDMTVNDCLRVYASDSVADECSAAAEQILELVRNGSRYRDISVVCGDMEAYRNGLHLLFSRYGIPVYLSGTEDVLQMPVINTALSALDAALDGLEQRDVLRYLKSPLSPLNIAVCDRLENYVILWNITGNRWKTDWQYHPGGLGLTLDDAAIRELAELNEARRVALEPLIRLQDGFRKAANLGEQVMTLYQFLEEIQMASRLERLAQQEDHTDAQVLRQLWDILLSALEQLYDALGQTAWDPETFTRLLWLLLSQYDVGTIPPVLDAVTVGSVSSMRCQRAKYVFVLGAQEGSFPGYTGSAGVLTDQDRTALRQLGVPLTGGSLQGLQAELAEIYGVFCSAENALCVSYTGDQPSFIYRRLLSMAGKECPVCNSLGSAQVNRDEAGAYLVRSNAPDIAEVLGLNESYQRLLNQSRHTLGAVSFDNIKGLYGGSLTLSASQVDKQADCRLAYFLKYGLRAKEQKSAQIDPAEFGTYVHAVLEQTARRIKSIGGFKAVSLQQTLEIAADCSEAYAKERFAQIDSDRLTYLFQRNSRELEMVVEELWQEMQQCDFEPADFETQFGAGGKMPAIHIPASAMHAQLRGFVDRVDTWKHSGNTYFRVVDYKTGRKDFDYCDVFNGLGLQMLLYLFALEDGGESVLGTNPIPAGVQYFPARAPLVSADGLMTDEEAQAARMKQWKRKGLLLQDEAVLQAMEKEEKPVRLSYSRKKDGTISGDLADWQQMKLLKAYVFVLLGKMVDDIASGCIEPNPYTRGSSHNACAFCPYGAVCHPKQVESRRDYKAMTAQRFWEEIGKEMGSNG